MTDRKSIILIAVAIFAGVEGLIIVGLFINPKRLLVTKYVSPVTVIESPIALAAKYDAPDSKFEEVVTQNLSWLEYRPITPSWTVLAGCAYHSQTNYVRILIHNGARVELALKDLREVNDTNAIELLQAVQSELKANPPPRVNPTNF